MRWTTPLAAALASWGGALAEDWTTWAACSENDPTPPPSFESLPPILDYEARWQILTVNAENGKLELGRGDFWTDIAKLEDPLKLIMTFGGSQKGKSVVASMLGCEMNPDDPMQFPTYRGDKDADADRGETQGVWASKPFSIAGDETAKYMLLDMQSLEKLAEYQQRRDGPTLNYRRKEDELLKILALMSEVVSTFLYAVGDSATIADWNLLGTAMGETRRNLVLNSKDGEKDEEGKEVNRAAPQDTEVNLKSHNKPALIFVPRQTDANAEAVMSDEFKVDTAKLYAQAKSQKDILSADTQGTWLLIERGFKLIKNGDNDIPFAISPVQDITESSADNGEFSWGVLPAYDSSSKGTACSKYARMASARWKCKVLIGTGQNQIQHPSNPTTYRLLIQYMTNLIKTEAPVRMLSWKGQLDPVRLTGARMKAVLQNGIDEMNLIGPLPRVELWRKIMQDRCKTEVVEYLDYTHGEKSGTYKNKTSSGILFQVQQGLNSMPEIGTIQEMKDRWAELQNKWDMKSEPDDHIALFFTDHPLLQAVQTDCTTEGNEHVVLLEEMWQSRVFEWTAILANRERQIAQERLRKALEEDWWTEFWNEYQLYILAGSLVGLIALMILMRIWRGVNSTCRVCASCCGDWGDTTTTTKIITTHEGKTTAHRTRVQHGPAVPFAAAVSAVGVTSGPSSADPAERLEKLGQTIKELQKRASTDQL